MSSTADTLAPEALSWALTHVQKFGDTDIFPVPFEYDAIAHDWSTIGPFLGRLDLNNYKVRSARNCLVVKPGGGYRAAVQLDPLDHLVYTAIGYESADNIESARIPKDKRIACSYRVQLTTEGAFFQPDNGWKDFQTHSKELADSGGYSHVLLADISDFYNQLGQHRIQNGLELAAVSLERSQNVEKFLNQLTAKQSQGLPVGPSASILLAESALIDVDNFLLRQDVLHVRYVDDFRVFCRSRKQAIDIRHALTEYLFSVHRLSLESSKTKTLHVKRFLDEELPDPEDQEQQAKVNKLNELLEQFHSEQGWYCFEPLDLDEEDEKELLDQAQQESFKELFAECVARPQLHLGLARHLLRKALRSRTVILNELVFRNLEALGPVIRDVIRYLVATIPRKSAKERGNQLLRFAKSSDIADIPFIRMWILELLVRRPDLWEAKDALEYARESASIASLGMRPLALVAAAYKQHDWVRSKKENWRNHAPWDRRALIWASDILPVGEKRPFLSMVSDQGELLDAAIAKFLLNKQGRGRSASAY